MRLVVSFFRIGVKKHSTDVRTLQAARMRQYNRAPGNVLFCFSPTCASILLTFFKTSKESSVMRLCSLGAIMTMIFLLADINVLSRHL
eukprot:g40981.t1